MKPFSLFPMPFLFLLLFVDEQRPHQDHMVSENKSATIDTIAILQIDTSESQFAGAVTIQLTPADMVQIDKLLTECIQQNNKTADTSATLWNRFIELKYYNRQYFPYLKNGERLVFVNCFLKGFEILVKNWKKQMVWADGGGASFFSVKISLTSRKYNEFWINAPI
jgi:hypothetical protein